MGEWISVKDKLPDDEEDVFIFSADHHCRGVHVTHLYNGSWATPLTFRVTSLDSYYITHWKPIEYPQAPESSRCDIRGFEYSPFETQ